MGKVIHFLLIFIFLLASTTCNRKKDVYFSKDKHPMKIVCVSERNNLILLEDNGNIVGYTFHPHSKYTCGILFRGRISHTFDTAQVYKREGDSLIQLKNELYGYFIYKKERDKLLVKYKTKIIGCAEWIFPNSNCDTNNNLIDTISLEEVNLSPNPYIAFLKEKKQSKYNFLYDYLIMPDTYSNIALGFGWVYSDQKYDRFQKEKLNIDREDVVLVDDVLK